MQTDRGIYHKRVCDRCGAVLGCRMMNLTNISMVGRGAGTQATCARSAMRSISERSDGSIPTEGEREGKDYEKVRSL